MPASNELEGRACPKCKQDDMLYMWGMTLYKVYDNEMVRTGASITFLPDEPASCGSCDWSGDNNATLIKNHP